MVVYDMLLYHFLYSDVGLCNIFIGLTTYIVIMQYLDKKKKKTLCSTPHCPLPSPRGMISYLEGGVYTALLVPHPKLEGVLYISSGRHRSYVWC